MTSGGAHYYHADALGSVRLLSDGSGAAVERIEYGAFGEPLVRRANGTTGTSSGVGNRFLFQGREWLAALELNDHRNRYYVPALQRWLNQDPIGERGGINLYRFARNNAVNKVDPLGLEVGDWYDLRTWVAPSFWSRQQVDDFARSHGYKNYRDAIDYLNQQLPNYDPTEFDSILSERSEALQITAEALGDASSLYIQAATSVTPTGVGAKCVQAAVRAEARNLAEQMALREAEAGAGQRIMQGLIKDPAFPENVWAKMQHVHGDTVIHYWQNLQTGERVGFKFKD
jgi:RHS repeat-associated protein